MKKELLKIMKERRSVRSYKKDLVIPEDVLQEILETATYAPTGGGRQSPVIIAVTDKTMRDHIAHLNAKIMGDENADPFYGAPAIALVLADGSKSTWVEDGTNVLCYLMLAAKACDVSSVWVHREKEIFDSEEGKKLLKQWCRCSGTWIPGRRGAESSSPQRRLYRRSTLKPDLKFIKIDSGLQQEMIIPVMEVFFCNFLDTLDAVRNGIVMRKHFF